MAFIQFLKPKNRLEEGGRNQAPMQLDEGEPEKTVPTVTKIFRSADLRQQTWCADADTISDCGQDSGSKCLRTEEAFGNCIKISVPTIRFSFRAIGKS